MSILLRFWVSGTPRPQGSKLLVRGRMIESSRGLSAWRRTVAMAALAARQEGGYLALKGPVRVDVAFHLRRPLTAKPDIDKLARAVLDALVDAGVLEDDSQVCWLHAWKEAVTYSEEQGATVFVTEA